MHLSLAEVRKAALFAQLLTARATRDGSSRDALHVIEKLGYVQLDTIHVLQRAHHHVFWTRSPSYTPVVLNQLLSEDKSVLEYWGHAASLLPMSDFRFTLPRKKAVAEGQAGWITRTREQAGPWVDRVLERIRAEGPLGSKDFQSGEEATGGTWWDWKPAKLALELLFHQGELMVASRQNFQKRYDLTERVLPDGVDQTMPDHEEYGRFLVRRALGSLGIARKSEIFRHLHSGKNSPAADVFDAMLAGGEIVAVRVEDDTRESYILAEGLESPSDSPGSQQQALLLSPFDNLIIQRDRLLRLFDFDYALECYLPRAKRVYGYFVLPILYGSTFIGRVDARADRKSGDLVIHGFWQEREIEWGTEMWQAVGNTLVEFTRFNACAAIRLEAGSNTSAMDQLAESIQAGGGEVFRGT